MMKSTIPFIPDNAPFTSERRISKVNKAVAPPGEARADFDIFLAIADKLGLCEELYPGWTTTHDAYKEWQRVSFATGGTFALVPRLFHDRPGVAAGFIGGLSTAAGIVYPLIFTGGHNIHFGYAYVALYMFVPITLFYFWAARYERAPQEHGLMEHQVLVAEAA